MARSPYYSWKAGEAGNERWEVPVGVWMRLPVVGKVLVNNAGERPAYRAAAAGGLAERAIDGYWCLSVWLPVALDAPWRSRCVRAFLIPSIFGMHRPFRTISPMRSVCIGTLSHRTIPDRPTCFKSSGSLACRRSCTIHPIIITDRPRY